MTITKHTSGPWSLEFAHVMQNGQKYWQVHDGLDAICCNQFCYATNNEANARLIAAAPDLLEALKLARDIIGHPDDAGSKIIAAAIAKAIGESTQ